MSKGKKGKKPFKPIKVKVRDLEHEWQFVLRAVRLASWHLGATVSGLRTSMKAWDDDYPAPPFEINDREARELLHKFLGILEEAGRRRSIARELNGAAKPTATVIPCASQAMRDYFARVMGKPPKARDAGERP